MIDISRISKLKEQIFNQFGSNPLKVPNVIPQTLDRIVNSDEYQHYLQAEIYRAITTYFLLNCSLNRSISSHAFDRYINRAGSFKSSENLCGQLIVQAAQYANKLATPLLNKLYDVRDNTIKHTIEEQIPRVDLRIPNIHPATIDMVIHSEQYNVYFHDEVIRFMVTSYLINAILQELISTQILNVYMERITTLGGRESVAATIIEISSRLADELNEVPIGSVCLEPRDNNVKSNPGGATNQYL